MMENYQGYEVLHTLSGSRFDNTVIPTRKKAHHLLSLRPMTRVTSGGNGGKLEQSERERARERELLTRLLKNEKKCASECVVHTYIYIYMHCLQSGCLHFVSLFVPSVLIQVQNTGVTFTPPLYSCTCHGKSTYTIHACHLVQTHAVTHM